MITEKGTLSIGVEYDGKVHRGFEIRSRLVKDLLAASSDELFLKEKTSYEVCCLASQLIALGDIPKEKISGSLIADMYEDDFETLTEAAEKTRRRVREFRGRSEKPAENDIGDAQTGI